MRLATALKEATAEVDAKYRAEANQFFEKMIDILEEDVFSNLEEMRGGDFDGSLTFEASKINNKYSNLFILMAVGKYRPAFGTLPSGKHAILLPVLSNRFEFDMEGLLKKKSSFIHEFVHYMDAIRYKGGLGALNKNAEKARQHGGEGSKYFNSPQEFNAYYQQGIEEYVVALEKAMKQGAEHRLKMYFPDSAQSFVEMIKKLFMHKNFMKNLDPKYTRKLDKRLADLYLHLKKEGA